MGAVTYTNLEQGVNGQYRTVEADVTFSASYATGGDSLSLGALGLKQIDDMVTLGFISKARANSSGHVTVVGIQPVLAGTSTAPLLKSFVNGSESANAANVGAIGVVRLEFRGH